MTGIAPVQAPGFVPGGPPAAATPRGFAATLAGVLDVGGSVTGQPPYVTLGQMTRTSPHAAVAPAAVGGLAGAQAASAVQPVAVAGAAPGRDGHPVIDAAKRYLGVPYRWGGTNPATGLDCSGFTQRAFADIGVSLPRVSVDQARVGTKVPSLAEAQPGDLVFRRGSPNHIGIYLGDGQFLHAPRTGDVVKVARLTWTPSEIRRVA